MSTTQDKSTIIPDNAPVLAMYDVRGIQEYIFRTSNTKDVVGASIIVEKIIEEALMEAVNQEEKHEELKKGLRWKFYNKETKKVEIIKYKEDKKKALQVLYIGGGNAYVTYASKELCIRINKRMSKYIIEQTYSLQLAVAFVEKTESYMTDYKALTKRMDEVKANMHVSKPIAALPVVKVEAETGYAISSTSKNSENYSTETVLKRARGKNRKNEDLQNYLQEKRGKDSTIAVVHIDGSNMGLRIRALIENADNYPDAVTMMRNISYNINESYSKCFNEMETLVKRAHCSIYKILVAGDDITYICDGACALASVETFAKKISQYTMYDGTDIDNDNLKFSICAGIAYIEASNFTFASVYEIAENCCESAKSEAKKEYNTDNNKIGNWVDFQIIKKRQETDVQALRERDYVTYTGEVLTRRPYFISVGDEENAPVFKALSKGNKSYSKLKDGILFFQGNNLNESKKMGKDTLVALKNAYVSGKFKVDQVLSSLEKKGYRMPEEEYSLPEKSHDTQKEDSAYFTDERDANACLVAKWYDALELVDLYTKLPKENDAEKNKENGIYKTNYKKRENKNNAVK